MTSVSDHRRLEIERKFLVEEIPFDLGSCERIEMQQGYLVVDHSRNLSVRIRRQNRDYRLTIKTGKGVVRTEVDVPIDVADFEALWPEARAQSLEKTRYLNAVDDRLYEIDVYKGRLAPLVMVEIEFRTEAESQAFRPPEWLGPEVTHDARYLNQNLARSDAPPRTDH